MYNGKIGSRSIEKTVIVIKFIFSTFEASSSLTISDQSADNLTDFRSFSNFMTAERY